jgi:hypothetical protein
MNVGTFFVAISSLYFFLSIYFGMLLYVIVDEQLRAQLIALATSFFVGGMVLIILFAVVRISGRLLARARAS